MSRFVSVAFDSTSPLHSPIYRRAIALLAMALVVLLAGCASSRYVAVREAPKNALTERLMLTAKGGPKPSDRTVQLLRRHDLVEKAEKDPRDALERLAKSIAEQPDADKMHAYAELAYVTAKKVQPRDEQAALDLYGAAVAHAYMYLFDDRVGYQRNPYDPQFRGACDLYNGALEEVLRIASQRDELKPGCEHAIEIAGQEWQFEVVAQGGQWTENDFDRFEFVSDYEIVGLTNSYNTHGLGVPLIAVRGAHESDDPKEQFYPPGLAFPVTAFLRVVPGEKGSVATGAPRRARLELHDPLAATDIQVVNARVPLESDLSTPLAYFLENPQLADISTLGLLSPGDTQQLRGLYMVQPYQPGKIPVLLVHGLWSSPITWMEMFNDLRSDPKLRDRYQFWFYLYPTGQPFWVSAKQMREDLARTRALIDPYRREAALDQMVLVGHSMGGLVSKMQTIESGNDYWNIVSDQPFQLVKAEPEVRSELEKTFFFSPNVSIRRVITIATPHRGSDFANSATRYVGSKLITLPAFLMESTQQLYRENPGIFRDRTLVSSSMTSIDSLAPDSPVLPVLLEAPRAPWVKHHNIVGLIDRPGLIGKLANGTDGVVAKESAHLEYVASEIEVNADHSSVHRHPAAVMEVRRILLEHLSELQPPGPQHPRVYPVSAPPTYPESNVSTDAWPTQPVAPYTPWPRTSPATPMATAP